MNFLLQPPAVSTPILAFVARLFVRLAVTVWVIGAAVALGVLVAA